MKKIFVIQLLLLFTLGAFSQSQSATTQPKTKRDKNIAWISQKINAYGKASNLFFLGKSGAYCIFSFNFKADSDGIVGYLHNGKTTLSDSVLLQGKQIIRFDDIVDITESMNSSFSGISVYDPRIELIGKNGTHYAFMLKWRGKDENLKDSTITAFKKLIKQNKIHNIFHATKNNEK